MEQFNVTGMTCAACQARVEKAVTAVPGVEECAVSLLTNSMGVSGTADPQDIIRAVEKAGYGASLKGEGKATSGSDPSDGLRDRETPLLRKRLIASVCLLLPLMYFSMGHTMWGWPLPRLFDGNHVAVALVQMVLAASVMVINQRFFISGFRALWHRAPNMDTLVSLGSSVSFTWSLYVLLLLTRSVADGDHQAAMTQMMELYFESAAMILTLITVGKMLEARSKGKTTDALKGLMKLTPRTAVVLRDGKETEVPVYRVQVGDEFIVRPGSSIPVDGVVLEGSGSVNESALTGESIPADKQPGDGVSAATVNQSGYLRCRAVRVGEDTTLSKIIRMVNDAAATKAPIAKAADRVSGIFVPAVICIAAVTAAVWLLAGRDIGYALARGISVLVISCPCALGLATPVAIMVGNGVGARSGILFKTAVSLEETGKADIVVLDKTGTVTRGEPEVTDLIPEEGVDEKELLRLAAALEKRSEHPLARAILRRAEEEKLAVPEISDFENLPGSGVRGRLEGNELLGCSVRSMLDRDMDVSSGMQDRALRLADQGRTPLLFSRDGRLVGMIAVADVIREDSRSAVEELKNMGIRVVMLTGDNQRTAEAIGRQAGVDQVIAGVLPDGKDKVIRRLKKQGRTVMVGDGINDAPALTRADMGIAIGAGTDVAIDAADVVLVNSRLSDMPAAVRLSRATLRNIHENLFWAFFYNLIGIPLAAGAFIPLFGWTLNPMFGAAAMSLSSFCVVSNALRLNLFNIRDPRHDRPCRQRGPFRKGGPAYLMRVEGMMCTHCENTVCKALLTVPGVVDAEASFQDGTVTVETDGPVDEALLRRAVEDEDYKVTDISIQ